ncbi:ATP-binding protein [Isoptericola croceus]|uniref:ATP-binding protein n=1 Tax=Isoptericola croceus TaxID=3031406 RepID=UPI0023F6AEEC|nr:ATP-binding protein [Isoptericola croceus]
MEKIIDLSSGPGDRTRARLTYDNWDDYGFKTLMGVEIETNDGTTTEIGAAKFALLGQESGTKSWDYLPDRTRELDERWASLGVDPEYYSKLNELGEALSSRYLAAVRDAAWDSSIEDNFLHEDVWLTSLMRFSQSTESLRAGRLLRMPERVIDPWGDFRRSIRVKLPMIENQGFIEYDFVYAPPDGLASPISALIGYNGTGKTTALARIAKLAHADSHERERGDLAEGFFVGQDPPVSSVIMVSYSAFDTFELPSERAKDNNGANEVDELDDYFGYSYCGLRAIESPGKYRLKNADELENELRRNVERASATNRARLLDIALAEITREPSMIDARLSGGVQEILTSYTQMSSGHKIVTSIILHLCAWLNKRSLVLVDEPETHLHPSLLSALMRTIRLLVSDADARVIIATHSPVVLQELPSSSVQVVSRQLGVGSVRAPEIETFAESLESISSYVFRLDASQSDYRATLNDLAGRLTAEEIAQMFPRGLPGRALSYVLERQRWAP